MSSREEQQEQQSAETDCMLVLQRVHATRYASIERVLRGKDQGLQDPFTR